jgi:competence protein ComEA
MRKFVLLLATLLFSAFALAAVNINTATKEELDALPEIGPVKAQAIVDYRTKNGPFKTPEDIMKVNVIKEGTYAKLKGLISVSGASTTGRRAGAQGRDQGAARSGAAPAAAPAAAAPPAKAAAPAPPPLRRRQRPRPPLLRTRCGASSCRSGRQGRQDEQGGQGQG